MKCMRMFTHQTFYFYRLQKKQTFLYINRTATLYFNTDTAKSCFHLFNDAKLALMAHFMAHLMAGLMTIYEENH